MELTAHWVLTNENVSRSVQCVEKICKLSGELFRHDIDCFSFIMSQAFESHIQKMCTLAVRSVLSKSATIKGSQMRSKMIQRCRSLVHT